MLRRLVAAAALGILVACTASPPAAPTFSAAALMSPAEFQALPSNAADHRSSYGDDPNQFGELRLPSSPSLHPVVILIHGGCWKERYASLRDLAPMADALKAAGIASWNIEYRRLPQPGSGWPGTYEDVGRAVDHLRLIARKYQLDLDRVVVLGHSAGGHLAMWTAARHRLPAQSPLHVAQPLPLRGVVNLAGVSDMEAFIPAQATGCRDPAVVETLLGGPPTIVPERYAQVSATKLLPLGVPQVLIWGQQDPMTPLRFGSDHVSAARKVGDDAKLIVLPSLGHFEIADPASPAWSAVLNAVHLLLGTGT